MKLLKRGRRLDPQLVDQQRRVSWYTRKRFGLAARAVEGEHQLATEPLAERILLDEPFELPDELRGSADLSRSASIRSSTAAARSSSRRAISFSAKGSKAKSASGGPRHSWRASRSLALRDLRLERARCG